MTTGVASSDPRWFLGRILDAGHRPVGTCFQVDPGVLVTASHVILEAAGDNNGEVWFEPVLPDDAPVMKASVVAVDPDHDLAVLKFDGEMHTSAPMLAYSDLQKGGTEVCFSGFGIEPNDEYGSTTEYRFIQTQGAWEGIAHASEGVTVARAMASGAVRGLSGCPVLRRSDNTVLGVLSGRYNTVDGWSPHRVLIARVENLEPLLADVAAVAIDRTNATGKANKADLLAEIPLDRDRAREDKFFVMDDGWSRLWSKSETLLKEHAVLIVVAAPGVGASTFAEHALAHFAPQGAALVRLEPGDWDEPNAHAIRRRARRAFILDLQDPVHDVPSEEFLGSLVDLSRDFMGMHSRLVITVRSELWPGIAARNIDRVGVLYIEQSPPATSIVEQQIKLRAPELLTAISSEKVTRHIAGRNAVQAMAVVEKLLRARDQANIRSVAGAHILTDEDLEKLLDDHSTELIQLFSEASTPVMASPSGRSQAVTPLSTPDRCLLIALACRRRARVDQLEADANRIESLLRTQEVKVSSIDPWEAFGAAGLRGRLARISAEPGAGDTASLSRTGFAEAVIQYVWDNYSAIRNPLTTWLMEFANEGPDQEDAVVGWLSTVICRRQDVDFLKGELLKISKKGNRFGVLVGVLKTAAKDPHMQRRCERLLYDWAIRPDLQLVVVDVAASLLKTDRREIALRRLQRVTDAETTTPVIKSRVAQIFEDVVAETSLRHWFFHTIRSWFRDAPESAASRVAFGVAVGFVDDGTPWLLTPVAEGGDVDRMLIDALSDLECTGQLVQVFESASSSDDHYEKLIERLRRVATEDGTIGPLLNLAAKLNSLTGRIGRNPIADLNLKVSYQTMSYEHRNAFEQ